jgi:hypothetical protein
MQTLLNPRWLLVVNTLPVALLFFLYYGAYQLISTLLEPYNIATWIEVGSSLAVLWACNLVYSIFAIVQKRQVSIVYAITAIFTYITFLYLYDMRSNDIIPSSIPAWMLPNNMLLYVGTFIMPTLAHALLTLVVHSANHTAEMTEEGKKNSTLQAILSIVLPPLLWFLFITVIVPFWKPFGERNIDMHIITVMAIVLAVVFLFGVCKLAYSFMLSRLSRRTFDNLFFYIAFGVVFPIGGLWLNETLGNVFGNFTNPYFYVLAFFNGVVLALPETEKPQQRLALFVARCLMFPFILYFFLIFLPYFPLGILAILALGAGFLMLLPLILMIMQSKVLADDFEFLYLHFPKKFVWLAFAFALSVLPLSISFSFLQDRWALYEALDYIYEPNLAVQNPDKINRRALKSVVLNINESKDRRNRRGGFLFDSWNNKQTPFISPFYTWLVMDNMTVSDKKLEMIEQIFIGESSSYPNFWQTTNPTDSVRITNIAVKSSFDAEKQTWKSWVDLDIKNYDTTSWQQGEYKTIFELPEGCFISDSYLWIGNEKVQGLLAEKKSAMWIYQQITSARRDPAIWHYTTGNQIAFNIFPFAQNEVRKTGIEFLHKELIKLKIDTQTVWLGDSTKVENITKPYTDKAKQVAYFSPTFKRQLKTTKRKPSYHFIVDCSAGRVFSVEAQQQRLQAFLEAQAKDETAKIAHATALKNAKITFANAYTNTQNFGDSWQKTWKEQTFEGGFFVERAIQEILYQAFANTNDQYPIIIVLANRGEIGVLNQNFADYKQAFPETDKFYYLNEKGMLLHHKLAGKTPIQQVTDATSTLNLDFEVLEWRGEQNEIAYLPKNDQPSVWINSQKVLANADENIENITIIPKTWETALTLQAQYQQLVWQPQKTTDLWLPLVKNSFAAQTMTPLTSLISLENEAQRKVLLNKQKEVLAAKKSLDIAEAPDVQRMSEPSWWICLLILGALWGVQKWRKP